MKEKGGREKRTGRGSEEGRGGGYEEGVKCGEERVRWKRIGRR